MNNTKRLILDGDILPIIPNNLYINFDFVENIVVKINNNEINLDKNKLEALLRTLAKEDL